MMTWKKDENEMAVVPLVVFTLLEFAAGAEKTIEINFECFLKLPIRYISMTNLFKSVQI